MSSGNSDGVVEIVPDEGRRMGRGYPLPNNVLV